MGIRVCLRLLTLRVRWSLVQFAELNLGLSENLILSHNLNTIEYFVYFVVTEDEPTDLDLFVPSSFHNFGTGGAFVEEYTIDHEFDLGTYWKATKNSIEIHRYPEDTVCNYARVMLWKTP